LTWFSQNVSLFSSASNLRTRIKAFAINRLAEFRTQLIELDAATRGTCKGGDLSDEKIFFSFFNYGRNSKRLNSEKTRDVVKLVNVYFFFAAAVAFLTASHADS
jgi:hypothetical protein